MHKRVLPPGTRVKLNRDCGIFYKGETGVVVHDDRFSTLISMDNFNCQTPVWRNEISRLPKSHQNSIHTLFVGKARVK